MDIKMPTSREEMDALRKKLLVEEISDDDLDNVAGGNDDEKGKGTTFQWTCFFCGQTMTCKSDQDTCKHMTKCPNNPWK